MDNLVDVVIQRLEEKGLEPAGILGFVRSVANAVSECPHLDLRSLNDRLHWLGWDTVELDEHTFQLILAIVDRYNPFDSFQTAGKIKFFKTKSCEA